MLLLNGASQLLRVVTGAAVSTITVEVSGMDYTAPSTFATFSPNPVLITTATTTTVAAAPGSGVSRNILGLHITNNSSTLSTQVTVQKFDGTNAADLMGVTLLPGENLIYGADGEWHHRDAQGGEYTYAAPWRPTLGANGVIAETIPRELCPEVNTTAGASGTLFMQAIYLQAGQLISNITVWSATTAAGTPTNGFFALYDANRNLLAQTANFTTEAWAANSVKTKALTTAYRVTVSGLYYIGVLQVATTIATVKGGTAKTGGQLAAAAPILHGTSNTGLTTTLPNPANAITAGTANIYAAVS